jgi:hypothetical protein
LLFVEDDFFAQEVGSQAGDGRVQRLPDRDGR